MILHTLNKSPDHAALNRCCAAIASDDVLVLLEDGVYCGSASPGQQISELLAQDIAVYAIKADVEARGLATRMAIGVTIIDYTAFVGLCTEQASSKRWG
jgi:tRNA 2-thiouridine synthesizing protein B